MAETIKLSNRANKSYFDQLCFGASNGREQEKLNLGQHFSECIGAANGQEQGKLNPGQHFPECSGSGNGREQEKLNPGQIPPKSIQNPINPIQRLQSFQPI